MEKEENIRKILEAIIKKSYKTEGLSWNIFNQKEKNCWAIVIVGEHFKSENYMYLYHDNGDYNIMTVNVIIISISCHYILFNCLFLEMHNGNQHGS